MRDANYLRARKSVHIPAGTEFAIAAVGIAQAVLVFGLLAIAGLLFSLTINRGNHLLRAPSSSSTASANPAGGTGTDPLAVLPQRLRSRAIPLPSAPGQAETHWFLIDSGLAPAVLDSLDLSSPRDARPALRRWAPRAVWGRTLGSLLRRVPALGRNRAALAMLLTLAFAFLALFVLAEVLRRALVARVVSRSATALRRLIHRQIFRLGQTSLPTEGIGPVINLFTREVNDICSGFEAELKHRVRWAVLAVGLILIPLFISFWMSLALFAFGGLVWYITAGLQRRLRESADIAMRDAAVQLCLLHEDLGLLRTVRVYGIEQVDRARFDEHLERFQAADEQRLRTVGRANPMILLTLGGAAILAAGWLAYNVIQDQLAASSAMVLVASLAALVWPITDYLRMQRLLRHASRSAGGVFEFLERRPELLQTVGAHFLPALRNRISFENVTIESASGRTLLDGVSFEIKAGTRTALMGMDDDSKYALVCLIPRLIDPKVGRVRIDGLDLRDVTLESLRAQVATVLQSDLVFSDSVFVNIGLGDASYDLPRIIEAAKIAHAHHFIQDLPHGYDTVIGPLGHYLRTDEQYRIALARAFLHDPSIVIIEEPNASLDDDTKHLLDDTIARLARGRTLIFLPHRLSTIRSCDQVVVLYEGRVESIGPPKQLQTASKLFRHLQYLEFNQFATGDLEAGAVNG